MDLKGFITKHASGLLSAVACVGVAVTAVLTHRATIKAQNEIKDWTDEKHDELTKFEKVQASAKHYILPVVAGAGTMLCIIKAHHINKAEITALTGIAAVTAKRYDEYRKTNVEVNGKEAHEKVMAEINAKRAADANITAECLGGLYSLNSEIDEEERLFYDTITEQYFTSTLSRVIDAEYHLNRNFTMGYPEVDVQMWCDFLGIENKHHDNRGWALVDDLTWIDFNNLDPADISDGLQAITIEPCVMPIPNYQDYDWDTDEYPYDSQYLVDHDPRCP